MNAGPTASATQSLERSAGDRLRSQEWFGRSGKIGFIHRSPMLSQGLPDRMFDGRPVIGICNTFSELTPCNAHLRAIADRVKRGVLEAGGLPLEFPVTSIGETLVRPTSMFMRNLVSMDVEESLRANPVDGVVLLTGCDKTTPALLMGAASCDLPTLAVSGGPMITGFFRGEPVGSGTRLWAMSEEVRAGTLSPEDFRSAEPCMSRSAGHCNTMGTASTMACLVEVMGLGLPGNGATPAVDARRLVLAQDTGVRIVEMVRANLTMSSVVTRKALENAVRANAALGGSTNAVVHLLALAGRLQVPLTLDDFDQLARDVPLLVDLAPSGRHLMQDFFEAGGVPTLLVKLADRLHLEELTGTGLSLRDHIAQVPLWDAQELVIRSIDDPLKNDAAIAVLRGNLAPQGAVIKPAAASPHLLHHRGRAVVFADIDDLIERIDEPTLDIDETSVLVLQGSGPTGYPGMPELGNLPLPRRLLEAGVTDMVRISDARMSGTAYGTVILHVSPESAVGGPLALVRDGDYIELDTAARSLHLEVPDEELARRRAAWTPAAAAETGGYRGLYLKHVLQADQGVDFDFLVGRRGAAVPRDSY